MAVYVQGIIKIRVQTVLMHGSAQTIASRAEVS